MADHRQTADAFPEQVATALRLPAASATRITGAAEAVAPLNP